MNKLATRLAMAAIAGTALAMTQAPAQMHARANEITAYIGRRRLSREEALRQAQQRVDAAEAKRARKAAKLLRNGRL